MQAASQAATRSPIRFVGSGSEYFRIWIVNLLLTLVTLGLYYPFAKVRRLRYFHSATEVLDHPLAFHGDPWKVLRGYVLVAVMLGLYSFANYMSEAAGVIALAIVAAVWPALWHSSLRFRLANTSWRSLRFRFTGSRGGAYGAMLPWMALVVLLVAISVAFGPKPGQQPGADAVAAALAPLALMLAVPALLWLIKRYQHRHYALGPEASTFTPGWGSFYVIFALAALMVLGLAFAFGIMAALIVPAVMRGLNAGVGLSAGMLFMMVAVFIAYVALLSIVGAFIGARLQNLVWNGTRSQHFSFASGLRTWPLAGLTIKNWLLIAITLGLYLPFAKVATARMRLQAVTVLCEADVAALVAVASHIGESAAGDAAGDLFGIDLGL
jgi:uncharacterized membrane protein YjgN (DUF898 family)